MSSVPESQVIFRFFKVMVPGFHTKLRLPIPFCTKIKGEVPEEAFLTSCKGKYRVKIGPCNEGKICFLDGWTNFVKMHGLKIGEFVFFEQTAPDHFRTSICDSTTCSKEFLVEEQEPEEPEEEEEEEEEESPAPNTDDERAEIARTNCTNGRGRGRPRTNATFVRQEVFPSKVLKTEPTFEPNLDEDTEGVKKRGRGRGRPRKRALSPEPREPSVEIFEEKPCLEEINLFSPTITKRGRGRGRPRKTTQSLHQEKTLHDNRNHHGQNEFPKETDDEKELSGKYIQQHAIQRRGRLSNQVAHDMKQDHFIQKIMSYNVGRCFNLYIPPFICRSNGISKKTRISLRGPSREWYELRVKEHSMGRLCIHNGWREFCASNNIELGDLCFFRIIKNIKNDAQAMSESIVVDVKVSKTQ